MANFSEMMVGLRQAFRSGRTKAMQWREGQLNAMLKMIDENHEKLCNALWEDLHKAKMEAAMMEVDYTRNDLVNCMNNLYEWAKDEKVKKGMLNMMDRCFIRKEPYGVSLIIGAWNYPVQLIFLPLIGAIAAGNCVVIKPSELSESTARLINDLVPKYFDNECVKCVLGAIPETTALLNERWDYIFYTGNTMVGKIVMQAASKHLTPVTLELGGKSPVYIDSGCDLNVVANRLMWGKLVNAGQTCVAPDYVMCSKETQDELVEKLKSTISTFFSENPEKSGDYGRIVADRHFQRLKKFIDQTPNIAIGGEVNEKDRFVAPTVCTDVKFTDQAMQEELFGPILPIVPVRDEEEAIQYILEGEKPLSLYLFTNNDKVAKKFVDNTSSGGVCINDVLMQGSIPSLPFGGVGNSGIGAYHGKFSFDTFSHKRAVMHRNLGMENLQAVRYPPYTEKKANFVNWIQKKSPNKGFFSYFNFWS